MFSWFKSKIPVSTDEARVEELLTRGVVEVIQYDSLKKKLLSGRQLRVKLGIDPTSPNLHIGRAVPLLKLRDFQQLGHQVVLIVGDGTGVVGDTSDKDSERPMLTKADIKRNMATYFDQAGTILDMSRVEKRYNSEWLHKLGYEGIGAHANEFSVADFIARDNIKRRLDAGKRVSLREMLYPLMQGYDSVAIKADVELGGTDQRFNLLAGRVLQESFGQERQDILMTPLIDGTDGRKMSSSWGNTVNLNESAHDMYAKIMKTNDDVMPMYFTNLTRLPMSEVSTVITGLENGTANPLETKVRLAHAVVELFHDKHAADIAKEAFTKAFQHKEVPDDVPSTRAASDEMLVDVLLREGVVASKADFRRLEAAGAITNMATQEKIKGINALAVPGVYKIGKHRFIEIVEK